MARRRSYSWLLDISRTFLWLILIVLVGFPLLLYGWFDAAQEPRSRQFAEGYLKQIADKDREQSWRGSKHDGTPSNRFFVLYDPKGAIPKTDRRTRIEWTSELAQRFPQIPASGDVKCIRHAGENIYTLIDGCLPDEMK